jgi:hypothetical protein
MTDAETQIQTLYQESMLLHARLDALEQECRSDTPLPPTHPVLPVKAPKIVAPQICTYGGQSAQSYGNDYNSKTNDYPRQVTDWTLQVTLTTTFVVSTSSTNMLMWIPNQNNPTLPTAM